MQCKICKTELIKDELRGCNYCPECHPLNGVKETKEQEIERLEKRISELKENLQKEDDELTYREEAKKYGIKTYGKKKEAVLVEIAEAKSAIADNN